MTTLHIDWTRCDGRGLCIELLPEMLTEDDWAYPLARDGSGNDIAVPRNLRTFAEQAVAQCPRAALSLLLSPSRMGPETTTRMRSAAAGAA